MRIRTRAASFTGLSLRHDRGALVRAVLEGVAYGLRDSLELLRELGVDARDGPRVGRRRAQRLWLEIVASVLGMPLERTVVEEGSAYGAALLAGVAAGPSRTQREAVAACVRVARDDRAERWLGVGVRRGLRSLSRAVPGPTSSGGA